MAPAALSDRDALIAVVRDACARSIRLLQGLSDAQLMGPRVPIVNPLRWELGHVAWFQEHWALRRLWGEPPARADADALYDSAKVAHDSRWELPLPSIPETRAYREAVAARVVAKLQERELSPQALYFHWLSVFHEDMHGEAFTYARQTLAYPEPELGPRKATHDSHGPLPGDAEVPGGWFPLGAMGDEGFVFDNEKWAHGVELRPFRIARAPVTNGEFAAFVEAGGYRREDLWSAEGWRWRSESGAERPVYWAPARGGGFRLRRYNRRVRMPEHQPVIHVNAHEAEAYCRWAGRRLPSEAEWELAASGWPAAGAKRSFPWGGESPTPERANLDAHAGGCVDVAAHPAGDSPFGCRQMIGNVWEWTASRFLPYPGFLADPYKEYSEPWFAYPHRVLRGGCWATRGRLLRNTWRNFYEPQRRDVFAGFRTCALVTSPGTRRAAG